MFKAVLRLTFVNDRYETVSRLMPWRARRRVQLRSACNRMPIMSTIILRRVSSAIPDVSVSIGLQVELRARGSRSIVKGDEALLTEK